MHRPFTDGAAAVILANEKGAKKAKTKPVWIKGVGHMSDAYHLGDRDLARRPGPKGRGRQSLPDGGH